MISYHDFLAHQQMRYDSNDRETSLNVSPCMFDQIEQLGLKRVRSKATGTVFGHLFDQKSDLKQASKETDIIQVMLTEDVDSGNFEDVFSATRATVAVLVGSVEELKGQQNEFQTNIMNSHKKAKKRIASNEQKLRHGAESNLLTL